MVLLLLARGLFGRVGVNEGFFGFGSDDLDVDVVLASKEEALTDWEVGKTLALFVGKFEHVGEDVDGSGGLFEEKLHGRVVDDGAPHFATHEIFYVLSNGSETKVIFTGAFGERKEEVGAVFIFHELPGFVDEEKATFLLGADDVPDVGEDDVHSDRTEFVF